MKHVTVDKLDTVSQIVKLSSYDLSLGRQPIYDVKILNEIKRELIPKVVNTAVMPTWSSLTFFCRRMLRIDETFDHRRWLGVGLVAGHRRPTALPRSDDFEPHVRDRGDCPGGAPHRNWRRPVQDNEGRWTTAHRLRAISGQVCQRDQVDGAADPRRSSQGNTGWILNQLCIVYMTRRSPIWAYKTLSSLNVSFLLQIPLGRSFQMFFRFSHFWLLHDSAILLSFEWFHFHLLFKALPFMLRSYLNPPSLLNSINYLCT